MKSVSDGTVSLALVLMASSSLFSMIGLLQLNNTVYNDFYRSGLHFSYAWAVPYRALINFLFAMGWLNIIAAVVFQSYLLLRRRDVAQQLTPIAEEQGLEEGMKQPEVAEEQEEQMTEPLNEPQTEPEKPESYPQEECEGTSAEIGVS